METAQEQIIIMETWTHHKNITAEYTEYTESFLNSDISQSLVMATNRGKLATEGNTIENICLSQVKSLHAILCQGEIMAELNC